MSYTYCASATFPSSAAKVPAIAAYLAQNNIGVKVEEFDGLIIVTDEMSSSGQLEVASLLDEHAIPYDHHHRDDNAMKEWTDRYRLSESGELVEVEAESETDNAVASFAKEAHALLQEGKTEELYSLLNDAIGEEVESIEDIASRMAA